MENKKIKILYFMDGIGNGGGIQEMVLNWVSHFDLSKYQVDILSYNTGKKDNYTERFEKYGGKIYLINTFTKKGYFCKSINETKKFFKEHYNYDIIHAHASSKAYFVLKEAKKNGIKIRILHSHCTQFVNRSFKSLLIGNILKLFCKGVATHYFACSHEAGYFLFGKKTMDKEGYFIPNGIDLSKFNYDNEIKLKIKEELEIDNDYFIVGNIGRFRPQKNHEFLINILPELLKINPKTILILCGTGELMDSIKKLAKDLNVYSNVKFLGYRKDVNNIINCFDIMVMTSLFEGLPVTAVEVQALGIPCVFSDSISKDTAINPNCSFVSLKDDYSIWAKKIIDTFHKGNIKNKDILIEKGFDIVSSSSFICEIYKNILENRKVL